MIKQIFLLITICAFNIQINAQVVLTQSNTGFLPGLVAAVGADSSGFSLPSPGVNQLWDYSKLTKYDEGSWEYAVPANKNFPDATFADVDLAAVFIPDWWYYYDAYYQTAADGVNNLGFVVKNQRYGVSLTGNPTDSCNFPEQFCAYNSPGYMMPFPMTMSTSWRTNLRSSVNFELTLAAYGLNKAPCQKVTNTVRSDTVIGWGKMRVPTALGPSLEYDVLMVKRMVVQKDSFYLAGAPSPQALLLAFGVKQGQSASSNRYFFYRANANYPLMTVNFGSNNFTSPTGIFYDGHAQYDPGSGIDENNQQPEISIYPNPANAQLFINSNKNNLVEYSIFNSIGKVVAAGITDNKTIKIDELPKGLYYTILKTENQTKTIKFIKN